ncbi:MAG: hypothetical protein S4CHLAM2_02020 [Chlamydiales bacterium]|nr:hypothetical protein [Chlamydiales bacterium]
MKKEQEQSAAKYTASGKRKFKATVLSSQEKSLSVFGRSATVQEVPDKSDTLEKLKFRMTNKDFKQEAPEKPIKFEGSEEMPEDREQKVLKPEQTFKPTTEDFRKKK